MKERDEIADRLRRALPSIEMEDGPQRDLWPRMQAEMRTRRAARQLELKPKPVPLLDWALLAGLVAGVAVAPGSLSLLLYLL